MSRIARLLPVVLGGKKLFPFSDGFAVDGALGPRWTGATWAISSGAATNTPTLGAELLTNGGLEAPYTDGLANGWTKNGAPTLTEEGTIKHGGSSAQKVEASANNQGVYQIKAGTVGLWYVMSAWVYNAGAGNATMSLYDGGASSNKPVTGTSTWTNVVIAVRAASANKQPDVRSTAAATYYLDDVTVKPITLSTALASVATNLSSLTASVAVTLTNTTYNITPAGLVVCLDSAVSPANFLLAYHNGTNALLDKCVGGTYTNLISAAAAYGAGRVLKVVKSGTSVSLYYNDVQIGTTQTVNDAGIITNTRHGMFSTYSGNTLDSFALAA